MGLRLRILLICLLLAGLSTLVTVAGVALPKLQAYERMDAQLGRNGEQTARLAALTVTNRLDEATDVLKRLSQHDELAYRDYAQATALMTRLGPAHTRVVALDMALHMVASAGDVKVNDFSGFALAKRALVTPGPVHSGLVAWPDGGTPCVAVAHRFRYYDRAGTHWGALVEGIDLVKLDRALNQGVGLVEVFDDHGLMLIPAPAVVGGPELSLPGVSEALGGRSGVLIRNTYDVRAYRPVAPLGWAVVVGAPAAQALLPLDQDLRQALIAGAVAMAIGALLAVLLSAFLVAPIRRLEAGAAALARGEWEAGGVGRALLPTRRRDELGRLAASFEAMAGQLRDRFRVIEDEVAQRTADLRQANERLQGAIADLEALDELKRAFLDAVSHELRTPLNFIMGYGSTLQDGLLGPLEEEQERAVEKMLEGADRLLGVVNDLIEISRLEAGEVPLLPMPFEVGEAVEMVLAQLEPARRERQIEVEVELPPELPAAYADPERVGQIFRQLLVNAIKFTEPGGRITIAATQAADHLVVSVRDTGVGIAPEVQPFIWEAFRQGDGSLTRRVGGTGVGLAIVKRLIEAMGERIEVESRVGEGSTFRFTLRMADPDGHPVPRQGES